MAKTKFALRSLISIALLFFVASKINWRDLSSVLVWIDWRWATLAFLLTGVLIAALAVRWQVFLRRQRIELPFADVLSLTWAAQFFNSFLPGSTGGDVFKIYQVCRRASDRKAAAVASVFLDRLTALLALLVLATIAFFIEPAPLRALLGDRFNHVNLLWVVLFFLVGLLIVLIVVRTIFSRESVRQFARIFVATLQTIRLDAGVAFAIALAFAIHLLNFLIIFFLARSLGVAITYFQTLLMMSVVLLLVMLPITINGHGLRELLLIAYFTQLSVHIGQRTGIAFRDAAVALSLLMVANDFLWSLPGGLQYLARFRSRREAVLPVSANVTNEA